VRTPTLTIHFSILPILLTMQSLPKPLLLLLKQTTRSRRDLNRHIDDKVGIVRHCEFSPGCLLFPFSFLSTPLQDTLAELAQAATPTAQADNSFRRDPSPSTTKWVCCSEVSLGSLLFPFKFLSGNSAARYSRKQNLSSGTYHRIARLRFHQTES
jgi:hypothetical protein